MTNPLPLILAALPLIVLVGTAVYLAIELLGAVRIGRAEYAFLLSYYIEYTGCSPENGKDVL